MGDGPVGALEEKLVIFLGIFEIALAVVEIGDPSLGTRREVVGGKFSQKIGEYDQSIGVATSLVMGPAATEFGLRPQFIRRIALDPLIQFVDGGIPVFFL